MQRSLQYLRDDGWYAEIVEHRVPYTNRTRDLLGIGDILALRLGDAPLLVQTTTSSHGSARKRKILDSNYLTLWLGVGGRVVLHTWAMRGARGERKYWQVGVWEAPREHVAV